MAKIGKRTGAKKYAELRKLQARVNRMLYKSTHIEKGNGKRKQVLAMKRQFYKSRGIKNPKHLSFRDLSPKDIKAYTELLKSIENNTFINPEKYAKYQEKMRQKFESYGYGFEYEDIKNTMDELSDLLDELYIEGLTPSDFWQAYNEITNDYGEIKQEEFTEMLQDYLNEIKYGDMTIQQFYVFADEWYDKRTGNNNEESDILYE